jgi:hypothetical protein
MRVPAFTVLRTVGTGEELLSIELLEEHARRLAALPSIAPRHRGGGRTHLRQLNGHMRALRQVYTVLAADAREEAAAVRNIQAAQIRAVTSTARIAGTLK